MSRTLIAAPEPPPEVDEITARRRIVAKLCPGHAVALRLRAVRHDGTSVFECSWSRCSFAVEVRRGTRLAARLAAG
jgi:hypothetical protein